MTPARPRDRVSRIVMAAGYTVHGESFLNGELLLSVQETERGYIRDACDLALLLHTSLGSGWRIEVNGRPGSLDVKVAQIAPEPKGLIEKAK